MKQLTFADAITQGRENGYASRDLRAELAERRKGSYRFPVVNLAYTDYGGDFYDKAMIAYFLEKHPENIVRENTCYFGQNAFVFGRVAAEFLRDSERYPLGYEDTEDYYYNAEMEETEKGFNCFLDNLTGYAFDRTATFEWLFEEKYGCFGITTQGLDFCESGLISELVAAGIITPEENA